MPPKPKFTREKVVEVALTLVGERGMAALTARELGERLGSSARPIFTVFRNMEELTEAVREAAMRKYDAYVGVAEHYKPIFKALGVRMVLFATEAVSAPVYEWESGRGGAFRRCRTLGIYA